MSLLTIGVRALILDFAQKMRRDTSKTREPKARYRVRNGAAYNAGLINRTMWIDEAARASTTELEPTRGRPRLYSDALIQALPGLKSVFRLPLRALQGFVQSLRDLSFAPLPVANDTTLCRRAQTPEVQLPTIRDDEPIHLVLDSTAVKVYVSRMASRQNSRRTSSARVGTLYAYGGKALRRSKETVSQNSIRLSHFPFWATQGAAAFRTQARLPGLLIAT